MDTPSWTLGDLKSPRDPSNRVPWTLDFMRFPRDPPTGSLGPWTFGLAPAPSRNGLEIASNRLEKRPNRRLAALAGAAQGGIGRDEVDWLDLCPVLDLKMSLREVPRRAPGGKRVPWMLDFSRCPRDPPNRVCWILDFSRCPRDPPNRVSWTLGSLKSLVHVVGGGCFKVTFILAGLPQI